MKGISNNMSKEKRLLEYLNLNNARLEINPDYWHDLNSQCFRVDIYFWNDGLEIIDYDTYYVKELNDLYKELNLT